MPLAHGNGLTSYYRLDGADGRGVLMLAHSLGLDHGMWDSQAGDLAPHLQVLRYDIRGHGASSVSPGDYTIEQLGRDALTLADVLGIQRFAFCGLSLGGMIGQWLAANAPERLTHLVLANTSARLTEPGSMEDRRRTVLEQGTSAVLDVVMSRFFSPGFLQRGSPLVSWARRTLAATNPVGYAGCCAAIRSADLTSLLSEIRVPTLVVGGSHDVSMPWSSHGELLTRSLAGARVVLLPTGHLSNLEAPRSFSAALAELLVPPPGDRLAAGMTMRRAVLGDAHVDRALQSATEFTRTFQELITTYTWGTIWTRPGLDRRTRLLLVLTMTASLARWEEFRLHLRAGFDGGLEWCDVEEALLQVAVYAGLPAANTGFHIAVEQLSNRASA